MSKFQTDYDNQTDSLEKLVSSYFSTTTDWSSISGSFVKVASSDAGFLWAYNSSNGVYVCRLPCNGNWTNIQQLPVSKISDIIADSTSVYILADNKLWVAPSNNTGTWTQIPIPITAINIFSTNTYIWAQDATNVKYKCPKPCVMSNWIAEADTTQITGSSQMHLYGKNADKQSVVTDENMKTGWKLLPVSTTIIGSVGEDVLYGIDANLNLTRYDGKVTTPVSNNGITPERVVVNSNNLWMISETPGDKGNLFTKKAAPSSAYLLKRVDAIDDTRSHIVSDISADYKQRQGAINDFVDSLTKLLEYLETLIKPTRKTIGNYTDVKNETLLKQRTLVGMTSLEPTIIVMIGLLFLVVAISVILDSIGLLNQSIFSLVFFSIVGGGCLYLLNYPISL
jgi:hypothetical protein